MTEPIRSYEYRYDRDSREADPNGCQERMIISFMTTAIMSDCGAPATDRDGPDRLCHEHFARRHPLLATECEERCRAAGFAPILDAMRRSVTGEETA